MKRNLGLTGGRMHSETVMLALTRGGLRREQAYEIVQRNAMEGCAWRSLRELLMPTPTPRPDAAHPAAAFDPGLLR
jgi:adenylosuccinate lyase